MARREAKVPLAKVWILLSYRDSRERFCKSWNALARTQCILLALSSLGRGEETRHTEKNRLMGEVQNKTNSTGKVKFSQIDTDSSVHYGYHLNQVYGIYIYLLGIQDFVKLTAAVGHRGRQTLLWATRWSYSHTVPWRSDKVVFAVCNGSLNQKDWHIWYWYFKQM